MRHQIFLDSIGFALQNTGHNQEHSPNRFRDKEDSKLHSFAKRAFGLTRDWYQFRVAEWASA